MNEIKKWSEPSIQSLARADAILEVVARSPTGAARLRDITAATGLNKTTVFNLVDSLIALRFLSRDVTSRGYRLGLRNLQLGRIVELQMDLIGAARASLMELCRTTGETVNLATPFNFEAIIVDSLEGSHSMRVTSYAGTPASYHSTSCGKAILAFLSEAERQAIYVARPFTAQTPNTVTDADQLEAQLEKVRKYGFAFDLEENELAANCVAAPLFDMFGTVIGSISVAGPAARMHPERLPEVGAQIVAQSRLITARLSGVDGSRRPSPPRRKTGPAQG